MARKLPKIESIVITGFLLCVALWAVSKCSNKRGEVARHIQEMAEEDERPVRRDTVIINQQAAPAPTQPAATPTQQQTVAQPSSLIQQEPGKLPKMIPQGANTSSNTVAPVTSSTPASTPKPGATSSSGTTLYVTIDGLNMRKEPGLKGDAIAKLELYEQVTFLNKKTEWTQEISLGKEKVTDHWVKVRTKSGKEGWVFGAGVHYYKMKRKGVIE